MIDQHEIKLMKSGSGYAIGKLPEKHKDLSFLEPGALVALFDGVDTMFNFMERDMARARRGMASSEGGSGRNGEFNAFNSYEEALDTFRNHPERVVKFDPAELRIKDDSESGQRVDYDVTGDYIDMGRFMEGIPESWGSMHNGNARSRRVNILVNIGQRWNISQTDITHRGERILRLVDALEAGGVRTQITGMESNECGHTEIIIKRHDEPLTISDLAVISHPEFLRRIIFRVNEHSDTWDYGYGSAVEFGYAVENKPELLRSGTNDEMNIFIDGNMSVISSIDETFDQLEKLLIWEMSKPVPEVDGIKVSSTGIYFNANGARSEDEIQREGREAINA